MLNINLEKIAEQVKSVLDDYDITWTNDGIETLLNEWYKQKLPLLELFSKHPNWDNDCASVLFETSFSRSINTNSAVGQAVVIREAAVNHAIGESLNDQDLAAKIDERDEWLDYIYSVYHKLPWHEICKYQTIQTEHIEQWRSVLPKSRQGTKTSRALRRLFANYGLDQYPNFERDYAILADLLNPLHITRHTALSLHPCDYLLMSHGTGWHSCHDLNGGGWRGGTLSYMLDDVTAILYTVKAEFDNSDKTIWNAPKINRMVCCFQDNEILFSRLYPQDQTEDSNLREQFRNVVQKIHAQCKDLPNLWKAPIAVPQNYNGILNGVGYLQYPDYRYEDFGAQLSVHKSSNPKEMTIGTRGLCPACGGTVDDSGRINCENCEKEFFCECCQQTYYGEDYYTAANGDIICEDCRCRYYTICECCSELVPRDEITCTGDHDDVCESCLEAYYYYCNQCGDYYRDHAVTWDDEDECYYCDDCYDEIVAAREQEDEGAE